MNSMVKQALVAATMALAAFASWAVTDFREPGIDVAIQSTQAR